MKKTIIVGCGAYLPEKVLTNKDLEKMVDTSDEWIRARTGITKRYIAADDELVADMAAKAARVAIERANIKASDIDLIIVATTTPDRTFPSTAVGVQARLGLKTGAAFDVQAVCSGFIYALSIANNFIKTEQAKTALIIGADKMSSILDWNDRNTCILFGDGAGAAVLTASDEEGRGVISTNIYSDGSYQDILQTDGGVSCFDSAGAVRMAGKEVFKHAVDKMSSCVKTALDEAGLSVEDIDYFIPHQANSRILDKVGQKLGLAEDKVVSTVGLHANTSAASIPLALNEIYESGKLKKGDLIAFSALGGGLTWGGALLYW